MSWYALSGTGRRNSRREIRSLRSNHGGMLMAGVASVAVRLENGDECSGEPSGGSGQTVGRE